MSSEVWRFVHGGLWGFTARIASCLIAHGGRYHHGLHLSRLVLPDAAHAAALAGGSGRPVPPVACLVGAAFVVRVGKGFRVLLEHRRNHLQSFPQVEMLEAEVNAFQMLRRLCR